MVQRLHVLSSFGVTIEQINVIAQTVARALDGHPSTAGSNRCELRFEVDNEYHKGDFCYIRSIPGTGIEVEIALPGIIASRASGFIDNKTGFWTAFLPPSFYR